MDRKKSLLSALASIFLAGVILVLGPAQSVRAEPQQGSVQKACPVLAGTIDKSVYVDYQGKRIYFCCAGCITDFNRDRQKYTTKMQAEGVILEDVPVEAKPPKKLPAFLDEGGVDHSGSGHGGGGHSGHVH